MLGGFLGVVILVGLVTSFIGTRLAQHTIMETARSQLYSNLAGAGVVMEDAEHDLFLKIRLLSDSVRLQEAMAKKDVTGIRGVLNNRLTASDMDFWTILDEKGQVLVRGFRTPEKDEQVTEDPVVSKAMTGEAVSAVMVMSIERLSKENPALVKRLKEASDTAGMVIQAAHPVKFESTVVGYLYGGILINSNKTNRKTTYRGSCSRETPKLDMRPFAWATK